MATGSMGPKPSKLGRSESRREIYCGPAEVPLPVSAIDKDDYPNGPTGMARYLEDRIEELEGQKCDAASGADRRPINKQLHACRNLLKWVKSRAGYVPDVQLCQALKRGG